MTSLCDENRRHDRISRYDEVNHLFWYTEDIARIVLTDRTSLVDIPPAMCFRIPHFSRHITRIGRLGIYWSS